MNDLNLKDYPSNKILKIKIKTQDNFIYGRMISAGTVYPPTLQLPPQHLPMGDLNKINDFEVFLKDPTSYKNYSSFSIDSYEIETIEIINFWPLVDLDL